MPQSEYQYLIRNMVSHVPRSDFEDISYNAAVHATNVANQNRTMDARVVGINSMLRP